MQIPTIPVLRTFMDTDTHALSADDDIFDAVRRLIDERITDAPVVDDQGHLVGMLSEYDCLRLLAHGHNADVARGKVRDFMEPATVTVTPSMDVYYVAGLFLKNPNVRRFVVMEGQRIVGVATRKDILRAVESGLRAAS